MTSMYPAAQTWEDPNEEPQHPLSARGAEQFLGSIGCGRQSLENGLKPTRSLS